jgi:hypothetical protein
MALATIGTAVVVYIVVRPPAPVKPPPRDESKPSAVAEVVGKGLVTIATGSALERKLEVRSVKSERVALAVMTVTGSVAARFVTGTASPIDRWQFSSPDVSSAYADWRRAENDLDTSTRQLAKTRDLAKATVDRFTEVYERMRKLVEQTGTESVRDLAAAQADLIQAQLQTQKDVFDAESAVNLALRNRAAAERTLAQNGVDPGVLETRTDTAIVVAEVPEARAGAVREGEGCEARFYAFPDDPIPGRIARIAPTLAPDRRTLRLIFELYDPRSRLRPGMFADVGLGTDERDALLVPSDAVVHVGRSDFVFARTAGKAGPWRVREVEAGEARAGMIEIRGGVSADEEVIGAGAILLKPFLIRSIES